LKGINTTEVDVCKMQFMVSPTLRGDFAATVELYYILCKQMKDENPQLNVSEVSFACVTKGGARTHMGSEVPLGSQMSPMPQLMTVSLRNMSTCPDS
jgi:hypothetical protein